MCTRYKKKERRERGSIAVFWATHIDRMAGLFNMPAPLTD